MSFTPSRRQLSVLYARFPAEELDRRALVAEQLMNQALENGRWHLVRRRRQQMLAFDTERRRRCAA
jgi:hypothetical protein